MSDFEGLCDSSYLDRLRIPDHWHGTYHKKGKLVPWNHVSPSQVESYQKCKRSWFFKSVLKVPEGQKGHQSLGEAFHLILERVPKGLGWPSHADVDARPEDWAKAEALAKIALPLLPEDPANIIKREAGIRLDTYPGGPTMVGYIDLGVPHGIGWQAFLVPQNEAIVGDYKTLSDFRYMRTPQELASSVQMMTYAKWAIEPWPLGLHGENSSPPERVRLLHMYARTKPPFTRGSIRHESAIVTPQEIEVQWQKTLDTVREMQQVAESCKQPEDVQATGALTGHCEAYGGCYFRDKCGLSPTSGIKTLFQITKKSEVPVMAGSSILDKIKAANAAKAQAIPSAPSGTADNSAIVERNTPVVNPSNQPTENVSRTGPISGLLSKIQDQGKGQPALGGAVAQSYGKEIGSEAHGFAGTGELGKTTCATMGELLRLASGVVPPDAPPRAQEIITRPGDLVQTQGEEDDEDTDDSETPGAMGVSDAASGQMATGNTLDSIGSGDPASIPEVGKKRGRPSSAELAARKVEEAKRFEEAVRAAVTLEVAKLSDKYPIGVSGPSQIMLEEHAKATRRISELEKENADLKSSLIKADIVTDQLYPFNQGLTLYIDCYPTKGEAEIVDYHEWIAPITAALAKANNVGDWREISYTGKGLLAKAIREAIQTNNLPRAMTIPGHADIAIEVLTPLAKRVIKRF